MRQRNILLISVILLGLLLRIWVFSTGFQDGDLYYPKFAAELAQGSFSAYDPEEYPYLMMRHGLVFPLALSFFCFGISEFSAILFSLLSGLGIILSSYFFARRIWDDRVGICAAFVTAIIPVDVLDSVSMSSDIFQSLFASWTIYLLWSHLKSESPSQPRLFLAGMLAGWTPFIREDGFLFALPLLFLLGRSLFQKSFLWTILGGVCTFLIGLGFTWVLSGDALSLFVRGKEVHEAWYDHMERPWQGNLGIPLILFWPRSPWYSFFGLLPLIFVICSVLFLFKKEKYIPQIFSYWCVWLLMFTFFPSKLDPYIPVYWPIPRYLLYLTLPMALILGRALALQLSHRKRAFTGMISVLLVSSLVGIYISAEDGALRQRGARLAHQWYEKQEDKKQILMGSYPKGMFHLWEGYQLEAPIVGYDGEGLDLHMSSWFVVDDWLQQHEGWRNDPLSKIIPRLEKTKEPVFTTSYPSRRSLRRPQAEPPQFGLRIYEVSPSELETLLR